MTLQITRKRFIESSAAVGGGLAIGGPLAALAAQSAHGAPGSSPGYGPLQPTPEQDTGFTFLALPRGFRYRLISKEGDPSFVVDEDGNRTQAPTPGIFDGMAAYAAGKRDDDDDDDRRGRAGRKAKVILIRNHENRERADEIPFAIPPDKRYDPSPATGNAGNTKLLVGADRRVIETFQVLAGTSTNCAGGETPWDSWITSEEVFKPGGAFGHGYNFEIPSGPNAPTQAIPIRRAGRFSHEAVSWLDQVLYETEDRSQPTSFATTPPGAPSPLPAGYGGGGFYRYLPGRKITRSGQLADSNGRLEMLGVKGQPNRDMDSVNPGETLPVVWYPIADPEPADDNPPNGVRFQGQNQGAASFGRPEGSWVGDGKVYFSCTAGGEAGLGQLWEFDPRGRRGGGEGSITLVYESDDITKLEGPDNVVFVPKTGDVFLQEDASGDQFVRGVTEEGRIYDFAQTIANDTEFCGGCFSPDGKTFFLNQQGNRLGGDASEAEIREGGALTYAIWGPFSRRKGKGDRDDD